MWWPIVGQEGGATECATATTYGARVDSWQHLALLPSHSANKVLATAPMNCLARCHSDVVRP